MRNEREKEDDMKRRAILLSHSDGEISSGKDADDVMRFLASCTGGAWLEQEIIREDNLSRAQLDKLVESVKKEGLDYLLFYFSGHGGYIRGTVLELNPQGDEIHEREVSGLVARQLNIFDCCRAHLAQGKFTEECDSLCESVDPLKAIARAKFNQRVLEAMPQQMSLYACREGECAHDFGRGGVYTQNLLDVTKAFEGEYLLALQAHLAAYQPTADAAALRGVNQHPDCFVAKLPSRYKLPLALKLDNLK